MQTWCLCFAAVVPYYYALGDLLSALSALTNPELINITALTDETKKYASCGLIDPTRNMLNSRVFIYNGMNDTHVLPGHRLSFNLSSYFVFFYIVHNNVHN